MATKDITDFQVVKAYAYCTVMRNKEERLFPYTRLAEVTGQCEKVCYSACERAARRGYIDWGTTLRSGWLTDKGRELLMKGSGT